MADFNNNWKYKYSIQSVFHQEEEKLHADPQSQNCEFQQVFAFVICQEQTLPNIGCQVYKSTSNDSDYIFLRCLRSWLQAQTHCTTNQHRHLGNPCPDLCLAIIKACLHEDGDVSQLPRDGVSTDSYQDRDVFVTVSGSEADSNGEAINEGV